MLTNYFAQCRKGIEGPLDAEASAGKASPAKASTSEFVNTPYNLIAH
jgi:hypothetical protein